MKKILLAIPVLLLILFASCNEENHPQKEEYDVFAHIGETIEFISVKAGEEFVYTGIVPSGFGIEGWYADEDTTIPYDTSSINEDIDIYAKLFKNQCTVTFMDFSGKSMRNQKVSLGQQVNAPIEHPTKLFREFLYWCVDEECLHPYDFTSSVTTDFTLYPAYKEVAYDDVIGEYVPDVIDGDLNFDLDNPDLMYLFESSDPTLISSQGMYKPSRTEKEVTIKLTINCGDESAEYSKKATVKPYQLADIKLGDLVVGYASNYYYTEFSEEILSTCNVINLAFAYVNSDGTLRTSDLSSFRDAITICHKNGVRVLLSIQGGESNNGTKGFSDCAADAELRKKLAKSMANACKEYHFDGIDIDWEYPGSYDFGNRKLTDKANFTLLMEEIRKAIDNIGDGEYLLTSAIPGGSWGAGRFELEKVKDIFDFINIMTYDLEGSEALKHHTALHSGSNVLSGASIEETVEMWHTQYGVPYEKMLPGCAFYCKTSVGTPLASRPTMIGCILKQKTGNVRYSDFHEKMNDYLGEGNDYHYAFDEQAYAPYAYTRFEKSGKFYTYDNERSLIAKAEFAKEKGLGGVMIWELGEDKSNYLITAVAQGMNRHLDNKYYVVEGTLELKAGQTITVKTVEEVASSSLKNDLSYVIDSTSFATINNDQLTLNKAGQVIVTAKASDGTIYGTLTINIK